jgi:hypothetical protein
MWGGGLLRSVYKNWAWMLIISQIDKFEPVKAAGFPGADRSGPSSDRPRPINRAVRSDMSRKSISRNE